jgi:hypothetical protein
MQARAMHALCKSGVLSDLVVRKQRGVPRIASAIHATGDLGELS